jgi:hypothetical protein
MKNSVRLVITVFVVIVLLASCATTKAPPPKHVSSDDKYEEMEIIKKTYQNNGAIVALGVSVTSPELKMARQMAIADGRVQLGGIISTRIEALEETFTEQVGAGRSAEIHAVYSSVSKSIVDQDLSGAQDVKTAVAYIDGLYRGYAIMLIDPEILQKRIEAEMNRQEALKNLYYSSKAHEKLNEEIEKFREFKKNNPGF